MSHTHTHTPPPLSIANCVLLCQTAVNFLVDNKDAPLGTKVAAGVTQILEKKVLLWLTLSLSPS